MFAHGPTHSPEVQSISDVFRLRRKTRIEAILTPCHNHGKKYSCRQCVFEQEVLDRYARLVGLDPALPDTTGGFSGTGEREINPAVLAALEGAASVIPGGRGIYGIPRSIPKWGSSFMDWLYIDDEDRKRQALADTLGGF